MQKKSPMMVSNFEQSELLYVAALVHKRHFFKLASK
jgi:hypothetical protein